LASLYHALTKLTGRWILCWFLGSMGKLCMENQNRVSFFIYGTKFSLEL